MNLFDVPWLELAVAVPLLGALGAGLARRPERAARWGVAFAGAAFGCAFLAWLGPYLGCAADEGAGRRLVEQVFGRPLLRTDELTAPVVPLVALLHFLTALTTAPTKVRRFSFSWMLVTTAVQLATFACDEPRALTCLLALGTVPPFVGLLNRGKPARVYALHMGLFVGLLVGGSAAAEWAGGESDWAVLPLLAAVLLRCGTVPAHCWLTDLFENASFGSALLFVAPLTGVYAAVRLVLPVAPDWALQSIGLLSLATAVYAAGMAVVQREVRRFFAYLFLSHAALVLLGLELHTPLSLTGSLCLWFAVTLSLGGFGLTLRALEARFGRLSLTDYHGLYGHAPALAACFLLTGLACVGFPGTVGFVSAELLLEGAVEANLSVGLGLIGVAALNGIAVVRAYFLLFTGTRHVSSVSLRVGGREQFAVLTLAALILGGGLFPQPGVASRYRAAESLLTGRAARLLVPAADREDQAAAREGSLPHDTSPTP